MRTTVSQYAKALLDLSRGKSASDQQKIAEEFAAFLKRKGESKKLPRIIEKAGQLQDMRVGVRRATVVTAFPIGEGSMQKIEAFAKKVFGTEEVILEKKVDARVLGGFVLKTDNQMVDASIARKMKMVRKVLSQ